MFFRGLLPAGPPDSPVSIELLFRACRIIHIVDDELAKMKVAVRIQFGKFDGKVPHSCPHDTAQSFNDNLMIKSLEEYFDRARTVRLGNGPLRCHAQSIEADIDSR